MKLESTQCYPFGQRLQSIREIPQMPCAICGTSMLSIDQVDKYINTAYANSDKPSAEFLPLLQEIQRYLDTRAQSVIELLENYSKKFPNISFKEILANEALRDLHAEKANQAYQEIFEANIPIFKKMTKHLKMTEAQEEQLQYANRRATAISAQKIPNSAKRYFIRQEYNKLQKYFPATTIENFIKISKEIPLYNPNPDRLFAQLHKKTETKLVQGLLSQVTPNNLALSNKGKGIYACQPCASILPKISFENIVLAYPNMPQHAQAQMDLIISHMIKGDLAGQEKYPTDIQRLLSAKTNNAILLNLANFEKHKRKIKNAKYIPLHPEEEQRIMKKKKQRHIDIYERRPIEELRLNIKNNARRIEKLKANPNANPYLLKRELELKTLLTKIYIKKMNLSINTQK